MLTSALHWPLNAWAYMDPKPDLSSLAAAYAHGIARNHPFVDGDNRAAFIVCRTFLILNGYDIEASPAAKYATFVALAAGRIDESQLAAWIRERLITAD